MTTLLVGKGFQRSPRPFISSSQTRPLPDLHIHCSGPGLSPLANELLLHPIKLTSYIDTNMQAFTISYAEQHHGESAKSHTSSRNLTSRWRQNQPSFAGYLLAKSTLKHEVLSQTAPSPRHDLALALYGRLSIVATGKVSR